MLAALGRWYGYDFKIADSTLRNASATAEFQPGDSREMLQILKHMLHVTMTFDGKVVTLRSRTAADRGRDRRIRPESVSTTLTGVGK
jgi:hypothetical protein